MTPPSAARAAEIAGFLARSDWRHATRMPLAGDASTRRYERLKGGPAGGAILMDAAPGQGNDVAPFLAVAAHLAGLGFSTPRVLAADPARGLLILEDFGDDLYSTLAAREPARETEIYTAAVDLLADLAAAPPPAFVTPYGPDMADLAARAFDWYRRGALGDNDPERRAGFLAAFAAALSRTTAAAPVMIFRDYHAENLIWLPDRRDAARVGLLDFQDARSGHPVYDLVSLLEDGRRDVPDDLGQALRKRFRQRIGMDADTFAAAAAVLAAQRNLRILGGFARLSLHFGKPAYVDLIPRVWRWLLADLRHPALAETAAILGEALPEPSQAILSRLKTSCGSIPRP